MFKKGTYYIGDLCYVLTKENWMNVCDLILPMKNGKHHTNKDWEGEGIQGEFCLKDGRKFALFDTAHGDGVYPVYKRTSNRLERVCSAGVDSGTIGCIRIDEVDLPEGISLGHEVELNEFYPYSKGGDMYFGDINVYTKDEKDE